MTEPFPTIPFPTPAASGEPGELQIDWPWDRPFYEGGGSIRDTGFWPVAVDGIEYLVDLTVNLYRRTNVEVLKTRQNRQANESLLVEPEVWRSQTESWHQGAGQTRADRETSLPYRFMGSKGVDVWREWGISLLKATTKLASLSGTTVISEACIDGVFVSDGTTHLWIDDFGTPSTLTLSGSPVAATSDGKTIYVAYSGGATQKIVAGVVSAGTALPATPQMYAYAKGFLLAGIDNSLYNVSGPSAVLVFTHPLSGHRWRAATDGLAAGYLLGGQGDKWFVYWFTISEDGSKVNPPVVAAPLPEGEIGYSLGSYLGFVLVGVGTGLRFASPAGDNTITYGKLIYTGNPVRMFEGQDRFVWFTGLGNRTRNNVEALEQPEAGIGRLDLATFTSPLTPAYAADLYALGEPVAVSWGVHTLQGRRVFTVPGQGVFAESTAIVADGWLTEGVFTMGVRDMKIGLYAHISCEPLNGQIHSDVGKDSTTYAEAIALTAQGAVSSGNVSLNGLRFDGLSVRHRLTASASGVSPRMTRFEARTVPVVGHAHEWQIPIILADVLDLDNATQGRSVAADFDHLIGLVETGRTFQFREAGRVEVCYTAGYEFRPVMLNDRGQMFQGLFILRLRSVR